jgi:hypothetical protein
MSTAHCMRAGSLARPSLLTFYFAWAPPLPPQRSEHEANTERLKIMSTQMRHREGGWPKDVDCTEPLDVNRYRKKAEKDDDYKSAVKTLGPIIGRCMKQNNTVNIYEVRGAWPLCTACMAITSPRKTAHPASPSLPLSPPLLPHQQEYFEGDASDHSGEPPTAKGLAVFRDPNQTKRTATSINWHPEGPAKIAVSYSILKFQDPRFMNAYMPKKVSRLCPPAARCAASLESLFRVRASLESLFRLRAPRMPSKCSLATPPRPPLRSRTSGTS